MKRMFPYFLSALSPFVGLFFSIRLNAFLFQWIGLSYGAWIHLVIAAMFFAIVWLLREKLAPFLTEHAYGLRPFSILVYVLSIAAAYVLRYPLLYNAIKGTDLNSPFVLAAVIIGCGIFLGMFLLLVFRALQTSVPAAWRLVRELRRTDWLYLIGLLVILNAVTWVYMALSKTVYFWDTSGYWETTHTLADLVRSEGIGSLLRTVWGSVSTSDYNDLIALPGTLLCLLFGKSRYVFVAGIINVYVFPLYVLLYLYVRHHWKRPIFITSALVLFFPSILYNALVGFIDVGGVIPCLLAMLFYFHGDRRRLADYIISGCFLALAVLLRRWYAFFALAFAIAAVVDAIMFKRSVKPLLGVLGTCGFLLLFFFQRFVSQRLLADYGAMYASYQFGLKTDFLLFFNYYGLIFTAALLLMDVYLIIRRDTRQQALFVLIQLVTCFFLFTRVQTHGQQHLYLYIPAFFWIAAQAFRTLICIEPKPGPIFSAGLALAILSTGYCMIPRTATSSIQELSSPALIPDFTFRPERRDDIDDLLALTEYLDDLVAETEKRMALLSSSFTFNYNTLTNLEISLNLKDADDVDRSYLLYLPAVDSRDSLPLYVEGWDYVVVADPVQIHLREENQQVVIVPAESFLNGTDIANAYTQLPETFTLGSSGIQIYVYEKTRQITAEEYDAYCNRLGEAMPEKYAAEVR